MESAPASLLAKARAGADRFRWAYLPNGAASILPKRSSTPFPFTKTVLWSGGGKADGGPLDNRIGCAILPRAVEHKELDRKPQEHQGKEQRHNPFGDIFPAEMGVGAGVDQDEG